MNGFDFMGFLGCFRNAIGFYRIDSGVFNLKNEEDGCGCDDRAIMAATLAHTRL